MAWGRAHVVLQLPQCWGELSGVSQPLVELLSQLPQPAASAEKHSLTTVQWPPKAASPSGTCNTLCGLCHANCNAARWAAGYLPGHLTLPTSSPRAQLATWQVPLSHLGVAFAKVQLVLQLPQAVGLSMRVSQPLVELLSQLPQPAPQVQWQLENIKPLDKAGAWAQLLQEHKHCWQASTCCTPSTPCTVKCSGHTSMLRQQCLPASAKSNGSPGLHWVHLQSTCEYVLQLASGAHCGDCGHGRCKRTGGCTGDCFQPYQVCDGSAALLHHMSGNEWQHDWQPTLPAL